MYQSLDERLRRGAAKGDVGEVETLLHSNANLNSQDSKLGWSALHHASESGHQGVVELLLNSNANVNSQNKGGWTPLHLASSGGNAAVVAVLLARKADPNIKNQYGQTARSWAVQKKHDAVVRLLDANLPVRLVRMPPVAPRHYSTQELQSAMEMAAQAERVKLEAEMEMEKLRRQQQEELEKLKQPHMIPSFSFAEKAAGEWSVEEAQSWVSSLGPAFAKYSQLFAENGLDGESLLAFDKGDLTALGVNAGHATMIIQKLKSRTQVASPPPYLPVDDDLASKGK